jgi:hypothetical protein
LELTKLSRSIVLPCSMMSYLSAYCWDNWHLQQYRLYHFITTSFSQQQTLLWFIPWTTFKKDSLKLFTVNQLQVFIQFGQWFCNEHFAMNEKYSHPFPFLVVKDPKFTFFLWLPQQPQQFSSRLCYLLG